MDVEKFLKMVKISNELSIYVRLCNTGNEINQMIRDIEITRNFYKNEDKLNCLKEYVSLKYNLDVSKVNNYNALINELTIYKDKCYNDARKIPIKNLEDELKEKILKDSFGMR